MLDLREHRKTPNRLSDLLPWAAFVTSGVILNKDGSLQASLRFRGPDLESVTEDILAINASHLNNIFRRFGSSYSLFFEARRFGATPYPDSKFPDTVSQLIEDERKKHYESEKHFESEYFLTVVYLPPEDRTSKITQSFVSNGETNHSLILESFQSEVLRLIELLQSIFPECDLLDPNETLTYLHGTISSKSHQVQLPEIPMYLDSLLTDESLIGGTSPKLGEKYLAVLGILGFPGSTKPALLDELNSLGFSYRWSTRFIALDKNESKKELENYQRKWFSKRKSIVALIKELLTKEESALSDTEALEKAEDAQAAIAELGSDDLSYGYYTTSIVLAHKEQSVLQTQVAAVERIINGAGFVTRLETFNAVDAWLGTIPGNTRNNVRRPLLNTLNLSHLAPGASAVWSGQKENLQLGGPPLFIAETGGSTPFRFSTHVNDVGHTLILGPTGAGKSTLLNFIALSFLRYENAQVYMCDKGRSALGLITAIGGQHYELGGELSFQPLRLVDEESEKKWAHEWLVGIIEKEGGPPTPAQKKAIWEALDSVASSPKEQRTLYALTVYLQDQALKEALMPYTRKGAHGNILDSNQDRLDYSKIQCFEMENLMDTPSVLPPVLSYLFHRLENRFDGSPTLLLLDEAWLYLDHPLFQRKIREWLKTLRKKNVSVIFSTQSLSDIESSSISATIKESCFTKIFLPNAAALQSDQREFYGRFGLNERQIEILARALPKRDYYYNSSLGNRLFQLALSELALAVCAGANPEQTKLIRSIRDQASNTDEYLTLLFEAKGLRRAA